LRRDFEPGSGLSGRHGDDCTRWTCLRGFRELYQSCERLDRRGRGHGKHSVNWSKLKFIRAGKSRLRAERRAIAESCGSRAALRILVSSPLTCHGHGILSLEWRLKIIPLVTARLPDTHVDISQSDPILIFFRIISLGILQDVYSYSSRLRRVPVSFRPGSIISRRTSSRSTCNITSWHG